jgi:hypothetical protein
MSQQGVSAGIIQNSAVGIFSQKTEGTKTKADMFLSCLPHKFESLKV